jgi:hypothetical protein
MQQKAGVAASGFGPDAFMAELYSFSKGAYTRTVGGGDNIEDPFDLIESVDISLSFER